MGFEMGSIVMDYCSQIEVVVMRVDGLMGFEMGSIVMDYCSQIEVVVIAK